MTANQINWFNAREQKRHNLATEGIQHGTLNETKRHNERGESLTHESNLIQQWLNAQTAKHYERMDSETARHNIVYESELNRHNVTEENIASGKAALEYKTRQQELSIEEQKLPIEERKADASYLNSWTNFISYAPATTQKTAQNKEIGANTEYLKQKTITEKTENLRKQAETGNIVARTITEILKGAGSAAKLINIFE